MISWKLIDRRLLELERALQEEPAQTLEHLNLMLAQIDPARPENALGCAAILRVMALAASRLGDEECSGRFLQRAAELIATAGPAAACEKVDVILRLAENLAERRRPREALQFAEAALEAVAICPERFASDEFSTILRRYADVASAAGSAALAERAYTLALLLVHQVSGVESDIADRLLSLSCRTRNRNGSAAIAKVGRYLVRSLRPNIEGCHRPFDC